MALAPNRRCPRCKRLSRGPCTACRTATKRAKYRERKSDPFYSSAAWRHLRAAFLADNPLCVFCNERGRVTPATVVDHVVPRSEDRSRELEWDNLRSCCQSCHNSRTNRDQRWGEGPSES